MHRTPKIGLCDTLAAGFQTFGLANIAGTRASRMFISQVGSRQAEGFYLAKLQGFRCHNTATTCRMKLTAEHQHGQAASVR